MNPAPPAHGDRGPPAAILHVDSEQGFGGGQVQLLLLMRGLRELGWQQILACPSESKIASKATEHGFTVWPVRMRSDIDLLSALRLRLVIRRTQSGIVHFHTGRAAWLGGLAAAGERKCTVTTRRMDRIIRRNPRNWLLYRHLIDRTVGISPAVAQRLRAGGVPGARVRMIWSALDTDRVVARSCREQTRASLGAKNEDIVVFTAAKLVPNKGVDLLLKAAARCPGESPLRFWIAGDGPARQDLEKQIRADGLSDRAKLLGHVENPAELMQASDIFALTSHTEGLGNAAMEAMALGLPVLATRVGGLADLVLDGTTGRLAAPGDVESIRAGLSELGSSEELRASWGEAGRTRIQQVFSPQQMVREYDSLYRNLWSLRHGCI